MTHNSLSSVNTTVANSIRLNSHTHSQPTKPGNKQHTMMDVFVSGKDTGSRVSAAVANAVSPIDWMALMVNASAQNPASGLDWFNVGTNSRTPNNAVPTPAKTKPNTIVLCSPI